MASAGYRHCAYCIGALSFPIHQSRIFAQVASPDEIVNCRTVGYVMSALASTPPGMPGTHPQYFGWGDVNGNIPPNIITYFRI